MRQKLPKILVTGGAGFIGSAFVRSLVRRGHRMVVVDKLTYAGDILRLEDAAASCAFYRVDICDAARLDKILVKEKPSAVVHFAAETHVDRSIRDATPFMTANVAGTQILMDACRRRRIAKFVHISSDEVYGEIRKGSFRENSPFAPNSPYAASKAAADLLVRSYVRTYGFPAMICRPCNNYGPWQYPEKLIPVVIAKALGDHKVPVYGRGANIREWLYVADCADAIFCVLERGRMCEAYNVGSGWSRRNIDTIKTILGLLDKSHSLIQYVKDRPGHDFRYCLDFSRVRRLGWRPAVSPTQGLRSVVAWYRAHQSWLMNKMVH